MSGGRSDLRKIIRKALHCPHGWRLEHGKGHSMLVHPSGVRVPFPSTPSDVNAARNAARQLGDICGCTFWRRAGTGRRSRKKAQGSGFDMDQALAERDAREQRREEKK